MCVLFFFCMLRFVFACVCVCPASSVFGSDAPSSSPFAPHWLVSVSTVTSLRRSSLPTDAEKRHRLIGTSLFACCTARRPVRQSFVQRLCIFGLMLCFEWHVGADGVCRSCAAVVAVASCTPLIVVAIVFCFSHC